MYVPPEIAKHAREKELNSILEKYEALDYRRFENYEKLCAEYRLAVDDKNSQLADSLYAIMQRVQKSKPRKDVRVIINNTKRERKIKRLQAKPKQKTISKKQEIIDYMPKDIPRVFSFENALAFFNLHRKTNRSFRSAEFALYFNIDLVFAENVLDLAAKMTILKVLSSHKYYRTKRSKIDLNKYKKFANLSKGEVRTLLVELIEKTGPVEYVPDNKPRKKKGKNIVHVAKDDKTKHYETPSGISYGFEIEGNTVGSDHASGGGRKKSKERTDKDALSDYRTRYGLNEGSILDFDLD